MISRHLETLLQRSKTINHLLQIHSLIIKTALDHDPFPISLFISNASPISVEFAHSVSDHLPISPPLFASNTIIREYAKSMHPFKALKLFRKLHYEGTWFDNFTYPFVLKACGRCLLLEQGKAVHCLVVKSGFTYDHYVGNNLLSMYANCGAIELSRTVFDEMPERDVVSWSSMIAGYVSCNCEVEAIAMFEQMKQVSVKPNSVTLVSLLCACTRLGDLSTGEHIHSYAIVNHIELTVALGTALLEMYSKCGDIEKADQIFDSMIEKNLQTWTVMICGLANNGCGEDAISLFAQMENSGLNPDSVSFSAILCACSHLGLVDDGLCYFRKMVNVYKIQPTMEHYGCMVDLFGRAGMVRDAYEIIKSMPWEPNSVILRSFLSACKIHGKVVNIDKKLMKLLLEVEPTIGANYVLAATVSALSGQWDDMAGMRVAMKDKGLKKVPGSSWVE